MTNVLTKAVTGVALAVVLSMAVTFGGCAGSSGDTGTGAVTAGSGAAGNASSASDNTTFSAVTDTPPQIEGLTYQSTMDLQYATSFNVFYYNDGFKVISVEDGRNYLIVPEGAEAPQSLPDGFIVLYQPLDHIYLGATSAMSLFDVIDGIGNVTLTGTDTSGWTIQAPRDALAAGTMAYAGKYNTPDYEMLVNEGCDLAIESTMILHAPEVQEMIEQIGIPVFIEHSSYEDEPLGRTEWVKVYGAMLDKEDEAEAFFNEKARVMDEMTQLESTGKTVVFFAINSDGSVVVRRPGDYISRSIEIAGGVYAFSDLDTPDKSTTLQITMEQFYETAVNADYLVYNGAIEDPIKSSADLIERSETFASFKAIQNGDVYVCGQEMYQSTDKTADLIRDFHTMVTDGDSSQMTFLENVG